MLSILRDYKVVPLAKVKMLDTDDALKVAETLMNAGIPVMELMFRRHTDSKAIRAIAREFPRFLIGAGGIMNRDQLLRAMDAEAKFAVSPGVNVETVKEANKRHIAFAPGVCTPSDIENALLNGAVDLQFFPAEQSGGVERLKAIIEPFEHLGIDVVAKGGITKDKIAAYVAVPQVAAVCVDWVVTEQAIANKDWDGISEAAKAAKAACSN